MVEFYLLYSRSHAFLFLSAIITTEARIQIMFFTRIKLTTSALVGVRGYVLDHPGDDVRTNRKLSTQYEYVLYQVSCPLFDRCCQCQSVRHTKVSPRQSSSVRLSRYMKVLYDTVYTVDVQATVLYCCTFFLLSE